MNKVLIKKKEKAKDFKIPWVLVDEKTECWELKLVGGVIEVSVWDGKANPSIWPYFDGFRCQIAGEKTIDIEFPLIDSAEEAKKLAIQQVLGVVHQLGAEIGFWEKRLEVRTTGASTIFSMKMKVKK